MGNRAANLRKAANLISAQLGQVVLISAVYETAAWGKTDQKAFLNQVLEVLTPYTPYKTMEILLAIEHAMGRLRMEKWGPRKIDLDILFYEEEIINESSLVIPHPQIENRKFVLAPLHEIAPNWMHPVLKKSIEQLLFECKDPLEVYKIESK